MSFLFSRTERQARRALGLALGFVVLLTAGPALAVTDCNVVLQNAFVGDSTGAGNYVLWLVYSYTASNGNTYTGQGSVLLSNPGAAEFTAIAIEAKVTQELSVSIRYLNSSGATQDQVCEAATARTDLIGMWLPNG